MQNEGKALKALKQILNSTYVTQLHIILAITERGHFRLFIDHMLLTVFVLKRMQKGNLQHKKDR